MYPCAKKNTFAEITRTVVEKIKAGPSRINGTVIGMLPKKASSHSIK
jgi:hypothetical protein